MSRNIGLGSAWDRYFFTPASATPLGLYRAIACGWWFVYYTFGYDFAGWTAASEAFYQPVSFWRLFPGVPLLADDLTLVLSRVFSGALLLGAIGLFTRVSIGIAFVLSIYLLGISTGFGKVTHSHTLVLFTLGILAMARSGDAVSLDALRRGRAGPAVPSGEYRWPIRTVWVVLAISFTLAGWQKVFRAGPGWLSPDSFTPLMLRHYYENEPWTDIGLRLAWIRPFAWFGSIATLVGECLFPLALISRRARMIFVPLMLGMQINITVLFGVYFWPFLVGYVFFVPWEYLPGRRLGQWPGDLRSLAVARPWRPLS
jgi:hypothetical protein